MTPQVNAPCDPPPWSARLTGAGFAEVEDVADLPLRGFAGVAFAISGKCPLNPPNSSFIGGRKPDHDSGVISETPSRARRVSQGLGR